MTHKHYKLLAEVFRCNKPYDPAEYDVWAHLVNEIADQLKRDNPNFKHEQFFVACGK